ncbi:MAG: dihydrofolate reductase [Oceanicoccus sp.]|jgi:dihydrofolate reductase
MTMTVIKIAMIVAMAENRVIGRDNQMPWHLPNDLKYFKATTMAKPVIMGRKTFDSIGRPLPGRANIVVTKNHDYQAAGAQVVHDLAAAIALGHSIAQTDGATEVMVIGGSQLYAEALGQTERLYLTEVHAQVEGDAFFPELKADQWQQTAREDFAAEGENPFDYSFVILDRLEV